MLIRRPSRYRSAPNGKSSPSKRQIRIGGIYTTSSGEASRASTDCRIAALQNRHRWQTTNSGPIDYIDLSGLGVPRFPRHLGKPLPALLSARSGFSSASNFEAWQQQEPRIKKWLAQQQALRPPAPVHPHAKARATINSRSSHSPHSFSCGASSLA
jgi:hypothetical protein